MTIEKELYDDYQRSKLALELVQGFRRTGSMHVMTHTGTVIAKADDLVTEEAIKAVALMLAYEVWPE